MEILVITTGGTIGAMPYADFKYDKNFVGTMPPPGQDFVRDVLKKIAGFEGRCISHDPRDSKLMDDPYRQGVLDLIKAAPEQKILITHGTDTILKSAEFFYRQGMGGKTVILTGSMIPLANGPESDGYLNLRFAVEQLPRFERNAETGIFIVLCDYEHADDASSAWKPKLYPFVPDRYKKIYEEDRRYSRLAKVK